MQHIYIVLSNNYTLVGRIVCLREKLHFGRHDAGTAYSHASLSLDSGLHNMLSFARKTIHNPFNAGLVEEDISAGMFTLKPEKSHIAVIKLPVTEQRHNDIEKLMSHYWNNREIYKYNSKGLIRILLHGRDTSDMSSKNAFFCSEWVDYLLKRCGIDLFRDENLYTVSPSDFYNKLKNNIIYEGLTKEYSSNAGT